MTEKEKLNKSLGYLANLTRAIAWENETAHPCCFAIEEFRCGGYEHSAMHHHQDGCNPRHKPRIFCHPFQPFPNQEEPNA